jgi:hypothetical protein
MKGAFRSSSDLKAPFMAVRPGAPDQRLCTYTAPKGSETADRLRALADRLTAAV